MYTLRKNRGLSSSQFPIHIFTKPPAFYATPVSAWCERKKGENRDDTVNCHRQDGMKKSVYCRRHCRQLYFGVDIDDDATGLGRGVAFIIGLVSVARVVCSSCSDAILIQRRGWFNAAADDEVVLYIGRYTSRCKHGQVKILLKQLEIAFAFRKFRSTSSCQQLFCFFLFFPSTDAGIYRESCRSREKRCR